MKKIIYLLSFIAIICSTVTIVAMKDQKIPLFIIPDSKSGGSDYQDYVSNIFSEEQYEISRKIGVPFTLTTPYTTTKHHETIIEQIINTVEDKSFLYALGDGVEYAFDYAAKNPNKVAGILAEGTILTKQHYIFNLCTKIPKDIPIIFVHNSNDEGSPYINIVALYHHLKTNTSRKDDKDSNFRTDCLSFVGSDKTETDHNDLNQLENDHKDLENTDALKTIHFFLRQNGLKNEYDKHEQKTTKVKITSPKKSPNQKQKDHLNRLLTEETIRYYKDWTIIIIRASLLTAMLSWLLYKSGEKAFTLLRNT